MEMGRVEELLRELASSGQIGFTVHHGSSTAQLAPRAAQHVGVQDGWATVEAEGWHFHLDLSDVSSVAFVEQEDVCVPVSYSLRFLDGAGESLLHAYFPSPYVGEDERPIGYTPERLRAWHGARARWVGKPGFKVVTIKRAGPAVSEREPFEKLLEQLTGELRESGRINFVVATGNSVFEGFPLSVLEGPSVLDRWMTLHNKGLHLHVNFARVDFVRFTEERGGSGGHGLPLSFSIRFCNSAGRSLLKAFFPIPHLDDEFQPCDLQPERVAFFRDFQERYTFQPGVQTMLVQPGAAANDTIEPGVAELVNA